ncbi:MAG: tRNA pseudouridine(55) synthase TruB [Proteobacteria bacterium]|uniref:tRNA pseudouridine synthase B n=1 Tax=Candidatus Enterousia avistercoris TaxID=2840788 RepID=A0A9D9DD16_9PROT|nr:tRNA pseudouridine(55) synthase TruB [Candidatus Enterousia avistercoris]
MSNTSGFILLDKPSGISSRAAGARIAHMFGARTFGHIGTLDPMASGVLPIAIGAATKMIPFIEDVRPSTKEYLFSLQFGFETDTLDITGTEIARSGIIPSRTDVLATLPQLIGNIAQRPPMYSAVHVNGRRAYELARRGVQTDIPPRHIRIDALELVDINGNEWTFRVRCGRGTYVRAIARDIAYKCDTYATVNMIRRTETLGFTIKNAVQLDFLENLVNNGVAPTKYLCAVDFGLGDIPVLNLDGKSAVLYRNGGFIATSGPGGMCRVYSGDEFIGIGIIDAGILRPKRTI